MSISRELEKLLKDKKAEYKLSKHPTTFTSQGLAHEEHISGGEVADALVRSERWLSEPRPERRTPP